MGAQKKNLPSVMVTQARRLVKKVNMEVKGRSTQEKAWE